MQGTAADLAAAENLIHVLQKCRQRKNLAHARSLLSYVRQHQLDTHTVLGSFLISMLVDCGSLCDAQHIFDKLAYRNEHAWTSIMWGYIKCGNVEHVFHLYWDMQGANVQLSSHTFVAILQACTRLKDVQGGLDVHTEVIKRGLERDIFIGSIMVDMYCKCDWLMDAFKVLQSLPVRDVVTWNALLAGYAEHGLGKEALTCFEWMHLDGVSPTDVTFACGLKACGIIRAVERGQLLYMEVTKRGWERELLLGNTSIDMYSKCGLIAEAREVLENLPLRDTVSWNTLIRGYTDLGLGEEALSCFDRMCGEGVSATDFTFACVLNACASTGALKAGKGIHIQVVGKGLERDPIIGSSMVDMYSKCGAFGEAREVFNKLPVRDVISWTAMIKRYGEIQEGSMAIQCFEDMRKQGVRPNAITFTCLLAACSHASLVLEGQQFFKLMTEEYEVEPTPEHKGCMIDLFARSGHVYEAKKFAEAMQCLSSIEVLTALLTACKIHGEVELGLSCFEQLLKLNEEDATPYLLMADIYTNAGRWIDANRIDEMRKYAGVKKRPASSSIEVNKKLHDFTVGEGKIKYLAVLFESLSLSIRDEGYVPNLELLLSQMYEEDVEACFNN